MASVYTNDLRLEEIGSGEQSGSWGDTTNTNLELIAEAFAFGTEAITTNADTHATTIADGATDPGRAMFLKYTGTLDSACTITLGPNTVSKLWFIENGTSGSQNIIIKQGSGATVTIPPGDTKAIYSNGAGSGGAMVDAFASLSVVDLNVSGDLDVDGTANLDVVDIDGAVNMATTTLVTGVLTTTAATVFNGGFAANDGSTITTADNTTQLTLSSTDADASVGPVLDLFRNSATPANFDPMGKISFSGEDADGNKTEYVHQIAYPHVVTAGSESGYWELHSLVGAADKVRITVDKDAVVINESSFDTDFRVESDGNTHALFVDGGGKSTGINVIPEASHAPSLAIGFGGNNITSRGNVDFRIMSGAFQDGASTFQYSVSSLPVSMLSMTNGGFAFQTAPAGTDGNAATFTTKFFIDPDGTISTPTLGTSNVRFGVNAGDAITSGTNHNVCVGDEAGTALNGGDESVFVGFAAGDAITTGTQNVAVGSNALGAGISATNNTAVGRSSMAATLGAENVAVGVNTLSTNQGGSHSVAIGSAALAAQNSSSGNVNFYNTAVGSSAGAAVTSGV